MRHALALFAAITVTPLLCPTSTAAPNQPVVGQYVRIESGPDSRQYLHFAELEVHADGKNIAVGKPVKASSTMKPFTADKVVDGVVEYTFGKDSSFWSSAGDKGGEWWEVDLGAAVAVERIVLFNRLDCCQDRLQGAVLSVLAPDRKPVFNQVLDAAENPIEMAFVVREPAPVDIAAKTIAERMAAVAPRFDKPADDIACVMPVGTSDLSAMLRYDTDWQIHLSKSDFFACEQKPYHNSPTLHSPGHVRLSFGIAPDAIKRFEQRIDYLRGSVVLTLATDAGTVTAEAFGLMGKNTLVVAIEDTRPTTDVTAEYSIWRPEMSVAVENGAIVAREVHDYAENGKPVADPATVNPNDRMYNLGVGTVVAFADATGVIAATGTTGDDETNRTATLHAKPAGKYWLVIASATSYDGKPEAVAKSLLDAAVKADKATLLQEHLAWWDTFWRASYVDLYGRDAERLMRLWYTNLYSYASVANSIVPTKFNGGPGLVQRDDRSWGWGYWWQNTRELIWPMYAANQLRYAREYLDFYDRQFMDWKNGTARQGKLGIRIWEGSTPFKPDIAITPKTVSTFDQATLDKAVANTGMETCRSGYNARSLAQSVELTQLMFDDVAYTGDTEYLRTVAAPWLKEATLFYLSYLRKGNDGLYHSMVSDAAEMWWKVKDPAPDLAAARYCFWLVINHGTEFGYEPELIEVVRDRLDKLAPLPTGFWVRRTATKEELPPGTPNYTTQIVDHIDRTVDCYAPAADLYDDRLVHNMENPELYAVFPFGLLDATSPKAEYDRAVNTFKLRKHPNNGGWSQCPVQAARLRIPQTVSVIMDHVRRHQKYPYGGWNSPGTGLKGSNLGVSDVPYFDALGVNLTALQETLLQSHCRTTAEKTDLLTGGPIVLVPAVPNDWAGRFRLRARGGFVVSVQFQRNRRPVEVRIESERGQTLEFANPFAECQVTKDGKTLTTSKDAMVSAPTAAGDVLVITGTGTRLPAAGVPW
ncbi:MAG: hypothetical protein A3K19_32645 [Lentisphaerae bacterium RIFOXYB12_FULL_65_16]|nr:MAG: hypothetical protein A3K18_07920 [Lentisphaerae bacterium RIFOXYA12_64_32]OGV84445.1 MAG: hypothetical protein A3K19_32645 [Lentisphaerae bacterium RIFOXYB12_FULL_65_16]